MGQIQGLMHSGTRTLGQLLHPRSEAKLVALEAKRLDRNWSWRRHNHSRAMQEGTCAVAPEGIITTTSLPPSSDLLLVFPSLNHLNSKGKHRLRVRKVSLGMQSLVGTSLAEQVRDGRKWACGSSKVRQTGQTGLLGPLIFFLFLCFWRISSTDRIKVIHKGVFIWERNVNLEVFLI